MDIRKMILRNRVNDYNKLVTFLEEYSDYYSDYAKEFILNNFEFFYKTGQVMDILSQLYDEFDMLTEERNHYKMLANKIVGLYGAGKNYLDAGSGYIPATARYIDIYQQRIGCGTIRAIDPTIIPRKIGNIKVIRDYLTIKTDIHDIDVITLTMPCELTELALTKARLEGKEVFAALCNCLPNNEYEFSFNYFNDVRAWHEKMYRLAKEQEYDGFEVYWEDACAPVPSPIIYSKRK